MGLQIANLVLFAAIFFVATVRNVHIGVLMFAAACGAGIWLADMALKEVIAGFPINIMVLLVGVTYFFGIAHSNGTIGRVIEAALSKVGNRAALLPLVFFVLSGGIAAMGSPLGGLVMAPIGMTVADKRQIDPMLMGLAMGTGISAGAFAPTSLFGIVTYGTAHNAGIDLSPMLLFAVALLINLVLFVVAFLLFGGMKLLRRSKSAARSHDVQAETPADALAPFSFTQRLTLLFIVALVAVVVVMSLAGLAPDIGVLSFAFGAVLALVDQEAGAKAVKNIDWSTVLLVGGILTYVGVLEHMGAVGLLGQFAGSIGTPLIAAFVICLIGRLVSAFASTTGMLAALVPLALPLIEAGGVPGWALICALGVCASIVDVSPFSTVGATFVATTVDETQHPRMTRLLLRWGMSMVVIGPVALVGVLVAPNMLF
jgi:di/tricarboxylate transporter